MSCRVCKCTEENACGAEDHDDYGVATCSWVEPNLCSGCVDPPFLVTEEGDRIPFPDNGHHGPVEV